MDYTIIGSNVNLASRIQAQAKPGGILISHATWALVKSDFPLTASGDLEAKGFYKKVKSTRWMN
ncbi:MAG: adenylate/guanylate cyclase domain-containing protein [Spirochaetales bacterium]|nr:adenylate/guanylate cyclase domain-containing protein [Spirochaetales bacterium]